MILADYLKKHNLSLTDFARKVDRNVSTISRLVAGKVLPDWDTLKRIKRATKGRVQPSDFID